MYDLIPFFLFKFQGLVTPLSKSPSHCFKNLKNSFSNKINLSRRNFICATIKQKFLVKFSVSHSVNLKNKKIMLSTIQNRYMPMNKNNIHKLAFILYGDKELISHYSLIIYYQTPLKQISIGRNVQIPILQSHSQEQTAGNKRVRV